MHSSAFLHIFFFFLFCYLLTPQFHGLFICSFEAQERVWVYWVNQHRALWHVTHTLTHVSYLSETQNSNLQLWGGKTQQSKRYVMELWYILYCTTANLRESSFCKHNDYYCTCIICCVHIVIAQSDKMHTKLLYQAKLISFQFQPVQHYKLAKCHSTIFWKKWN